MLRVLRPRFRLGAQPRVCSGRAVGRRREGLRLVARECCDDRSETVGIADDVVADAQLLTKSLDLIDDLFDRTDQHKWRIRKDVGVHFEFFDQFVDRGRIIVERGQLHER